MYRITARVRRYVNNLRNKVENKELKLTHFLTSAKLKKFWTILDEKEIQSMLVYVKRHCALLGKCSMLYCTAVFCF